MSKFKKQNKKAAPGVNTSSLPDIVFMLLFFFMVATTSKESDPTVKVTQPDGTHTTDMTPFKQRSEIDFLYLGEPRNAARKSQFKMGYALFLDNVAQPDPNELYNTNAIRNWKLEKFQAKQGRLRVGLEGNYLRQSRSRSSYWIDFRYPKRTARHRCIIHRICGSR